MTRASVVRRVTAVVGGILTALLLTTTAASAAIIKIQSDQTCNVNGLDTSPTTAVGGVHCDNGNPFSLEALLTGNLSLFVGNSQTPSWDFINDTGQTLTSLTLFYSGQLATNSFIDMQVSGTTLFTSCSATTANNVVTSDTHCGTGDITANNPLLPLMMVWSGGTGLGIGQTFNIGTASFAHAGQDAGCISGTRTCSPVPESSVVTFVGAALLALTLASGHRRRQGRSMRAAGLSAAARS